MSSVMHEMRLASTATPHTFKSRLTIAKADAGPAEFLAFIFTMRCWLTPEIGRSPHMPNTVRPARHPLGWLVGYGDTVEGKWLAVRASAENHLLSQADSALASVSARPTVESPDGWFQKTGMA